MKYVLDASVALKWLLLSPIRTKPSRPRDEFQRGLHEFLAPDVFPVEVAHALTRAERRRGVPVGQSGLLLMDLLAASPRLYSSLPLLARAVTMSSQTRTGVYDCLYLALAETEQCPFLTADGKLIAAFSTTHHLVDLARV